jgi:transcriptional regulator with XRE-family HTH domain
MESIKEPHQRLRTTRIAKGYSNAKIFVQEHNIAYTTYIAHESGKIPISKKAANNYAEILKVPANWLLHGDFGLEDKTSENTTSLHLRKRALESTIIPMVVISILKILRKYDENINYYNLIKKAHVITSEILAKTDDMDEIETLVSTIVALEEENLQKSILK